MITNIIFDFFGTLVGYSEEWDITRENTSYEYFSTLGFSMEKQEFIQKYGECFMDLTKKATENRNEFHMYDLGKYFFQKYFQYNLSSYILRFLTTFDINLKSLSLCNKYKLFSIAVSAINKSIILLIVIPFCLHKIFIIEAFS